MNVDSVSQPLWLDNIQDTIHDVVNNFVDHATGKLFEKVVLQVPCSCVTKYESFVTELGARAVLKQRNPYMETTCPKANCGQEREWAVQVPELDKLLQKIQYIVDSIGLQGNTLQWKNSCSMFLKGDPIILSMINYNIQNSSSSLRDLNHNNEPRMTENPQRKWYMITSAAGFFPRAEGVLGDIRHLQHDANWRGIPLPKINQLITLVQFIVRQLEDELIPDGYFVEKHRERSFETVPGLNATDTLLPLLAQIKSPIEQKQPYILSAAAGIFGEAPHVVQTAEEMLSKHLHQKYPHLNAEIVLPPYQSLAVSKQLPSASPPGGPNISHGSAGFSQPQFAQVGQPIAPPAIIGPAAAAVELPSYKAVCDAAGKFPWKSGVSFGLRWGDQKGWVSGDGKGVYLVSQEWHPIKQIYICHDSSGFHVTLDLQKTQLHDKVNKEFQEFAEASSFDSIEYNPQWSRWTFKKPGEVKWIMDVIKANCNMPEELELAIYRDFKNPPFVRESRILQDGWH